VLFLGLERGAKAPLFHSVRHGGTAEAVPFPVESARRFGSAFDFPGSIFLVRSSYLMASGMG
jgi:hypothetical protein